jgi:hypothetical protein
MDQNLFQQKREKKLNDYCQIQKKENSKKGKTKNTKRKEKRKREQ